MLFWNLHTCSWSKAMEPFIFYKNWLFVTWGDAMVKNLMPWLFPGSITLQIFVNGHNRLGDEVFACYCEICTVVHDLRPWIPSFFSKIGFLWHEVMPWWKIRCDGCSLQVKLCKTLWMVRIGWEMRFLHAIMKFAPLFMIWGPGSLHFFQKLAVCDMRWCHGGKSDAMAVPYK